MRRSIGICVLIVMLTAGGCSLFRSAPPPAPAPLPPSPQVTPPTKGAIIGVASWYGPGFNGHRTANGEIYDQEDLTAASTVIPIGSYVMVTNLANGRSVEVRINDHGPYKKGRKIDLSHRAATILGITDMGTARVRMDVPSVPAGSRMPGTPIRYYVQAGCYSNSSSANRVCRDLSSSYGDVRVLRVSAGRQHYYRVRMGAFSSRIDAVHRADACSLRYSYPMVIVSE